MKKYLPILFIFTCALSCKKKEKLQESTWTVNGELFTAIPQKSIGKAVAVISSNNFHNRFAISFNSSYLPTEGTVNAYINFYYNDVFYVPLNNDTLNASLCNEKAPYSLPASWFFNYYNHSDSVLISGNFYEP